MKVSVVIPTSNRRPEKLVRAVRSVLDQALGAEDSLEVVVVNNSESPLPDAVHDLAERTGVRVVASAGREGASHARNEGARIASHSLLSFLDDDDWWEPSFLAATSAPVLSNRADLACCGFWKRLDGGKRVEGKLAQPPVTIESLYVSNPGFQGSNFVIRKEVFDDVGGFDETLVTSNDKDFLVRLLRRGHRLEVVQERLVNLDRSADERLTQLGRNKVLGTRRFLEIHAGHMSRSSRRRIRFKLRLQEALTDRSYLGLALLALANPRKARKILSRTAALARGRPVKV